MYEMMKTYQGGKPFNNNAMSEMNRLRGNKELKINILSKKPF